jgi:predicted O-methyltransferase YrrM
MIPVWMGSPPSWDVQDIVLALFQDSDRKAVEDHRLQLLLNHGFFKAVNEVYTPIRKRRFAHDGWPELLYLLIRALKPRVVVETGVFDGISSCIILQALHDNDHGQCISIDLPATDVIPGSTDRMSSKTLPAGKQPGWTIPEYLRLRHTLRLGDSRELLPSILRQHSEIDVFFHDSLHTFEHQMFEYKLAWEHLSEGGLLLSDDIFWSSAFHQFCSANTRSYKRISQFGATRKQSGTAAESPRRS